MHTITLTKSVNSPILNGMAHNLKCRMCDNWFESRQPNTKVCSEKCRREWQNQTTGRYSDKSITGGTVGAISELSISADLMKKGYAVFRALSPSCFCDLVAFKNKKSLFIDVKTGYKGLSGNYNFPKNIQDNTDLFAIYIRKDSDIVYFGRDGKTRIIV